jgi:hypothetical protein
MELSRGGVRGCPAATTTTQLATRRSHVPSVCLRRTFSAWASATALPDAFFCRRPLPAVMGLGGSRQLQTNSTPTFGLRASFTMAFDTASALVLLLAELDTAW